MRQLLIKMTEAEKAGKVYEIQLEETVVYIQKKMRIYGDGLFGVIFPKLSSNS